VQQVIGTGAKEVLYKDGDSTMVSGMARRSIFELTGLRCSHGIDEQLYLVCRVPRSHTPHRNTRSPCAYSVSFGVVDKLSACIPFQQETFDLPPCKGFSVLDKVPFDAKGI
jgi:hypothetical protein